MSRALCITGMHRSGTSLTASWLEQCGLRIHDGNVVGPATGNTSGHFEDRDFVSLHSSALLRENPASKGWKVSRKSARCFDTEHILIARDLILQRSGSFEMWGWKDPRSVLFIEQWKELIPDLKILMVWRPCSHVVSSLTTRSRSAGSELYRVGLLEAAKLWSTYNLNVRDLVRKFPTEVILVSLEHVLGRDHITFQEIEKLTKGRLAYVPVTSVYDQKLLHTNAFVDAARLVSLAVGSPRLERQLRFLSLPHNSHPNIQ